MNSPDPADYVAVQRNDLDGRLHIVQPGTTLYVDRGENSTYFRMVSRAPNGADPGMILCGDGEHGPELIGVKIVRREDAMTEAMYACEAAAQAYRAMAHNEDHHVSTSRGRMYQNSVRLLLVSIEQAYGLTRHRAKQVHDLMIDSGEDVNYCVKYAIKQNWRDLPRI
jgi:hypothetical protein